MKTVQIIDSVWSAIVTRAAELEVSPEVLINTILARSEKIETEEMKNVLDND